MRAREPLFLDLAHFSMPVDSYPGLPSRSSPPLPPLLPIYPALQSVSSVTRAPPPPPLSRRVRHLLPPPRPDDDGRTGSFLPPLRYREERRCRCVFARSPALQKTVRPSAGASSPASAAPSLNLRSRTNGSMPPWRQVVYRRCSLSSRKSLHIYICLLIL